MLPSEISPGLCGRPIIDPATGRVAGFWLWPGSSQVFGAESVQTIEPKHVYLSEESAICELAELVRLAQIAQQRCPIFSQKVETRSGASLGRVADIELDTSSWQLENILTARTFFRIPLIGRAIIHRRQILDISPEKIVVADAAIPAVEKRKVLPRRLAPQPLSSAR